jgi:hypothetical protein
MHDDHGHQRVDSDRCHERADYDATFAIDATQRYLLHNRTPRRIHIVNQHGDEMVLPPLAQRVIIGARLCPFRAEIRHLRQHHQLRVRDYRPAHATSRVATAAVWAAIVVLVVVVVHALLDVGTLERRVVLVAALVAGGAVVGLLGTASIREAARRHTETFSDTDEGDIDFGVGGAFYDGNETLRRTKHALTLVTIVLVGAVLPAVAIFVATDAKDFLVMRGGLDVLDGHESELVGRLIQVLYTAVLSLFPAMLYFQFDRHRVGTLRSEWVRAIFRMDRRMETLADVNARYGDELAEASTFSTDSVRLLGGRNSPIVVATLLVSLGWTLLVIQTQSFRFDKPGDTPDRPYFEFLVPTPSAATMAFLGAYFFGIYLLLRGYFQGDLRPKIYNQISARLVTVVVLAYLIQTLFLDTESPNRGIWALSFMAGVVPTTVIQQVSRLAATVVGKLPWAKADEQGALGEVFANRRKLTQLDGLDINDSTRLESEGIMDIPSLASADLVSLMINTRLPVDRLVDWMDQAVLLLLIGDPVSDALDPRVSQLREIGVRTATGVLHATAPGGPAELSASIGAILRDGRAESRALTPEALAAMIRREPAMRRVVQWHESKLAAVHKRCETITLPTPVRSAQPAQPAQPAPEPAQPAPARPRKRLAA